MIGLYHQIKKMGYILVVTKGKEVRKHFNAVLNIITRQLIFYHIIFIGKALIHKTFKWLEI